MANPTVLEQVKLALRLKTAAFDDGEIIPLLNSGLADMRARGLAVPDTDGYEKAGPLVVQALKLYVKAYFGYSDDSEMLVNAYEALRDSMALMSEYTEGKP